MEAIKNLRESSALLSNLGFISYYQVAYSIYGERNIVDVCEIIHDPSEYVDTLTAIVNNCASLRSKTIYDGLLAYATEDDYRAIYEELLAIHQWIEDEKAVHLYDIEEEMEEAGAYDWFNDPEEEMDDHIAFCAILDPDPVRPQDPHGLPF